MGKRNWVKIPAHLPGDRLPMISVISDEPAQTTVIRTVRRYNEAYVYALGGFLLTSLLRRGRMQSPKSLELPVTEAERRNDRLRFYFRQSSALIGFLVFVGGLLVLPSSKGGAWEADSSTTGLVMMALSVVFIAASAVFRSRLAIRMNRSGIEMKVGPLFVQQLKASAHPTADWDGSQNDHLSAPAALKPSPVRTLPPLGSPSSQRQTSGAMGSTGESGSDARGQVSEGEV